MRPSNLRCIAQNSLSHHNEPCLAGSKRQHQLITSEPTRVLRVSHPPAVLIDEDILHNAMILFGEIERILMFPDKSYALVEFKSVEEARRVKEGLQGKLFNNPNILIEYSNISIPGARGHIGDFPIQPVHMDVLGRNRPLLLGNGPPHPPALGICAPDHFIGPSPHSLMGGPNRRKSYLTPGVGSSSSAGFHVANTSASGAWDGSYSSQPQRKSKMLRSDIAWPENQVGLDELYGSQSGAVGSLMVCKPGQENAESDCTWRGLIAMDRTPVCCARCFPIGEGFVANIPEVVNCSSKIGLDYLRKHYEDITDVVVFLPNSEEDFPSYTNLMRYLSSIQKAGVAEFDDVTTLFLVPPSGFLTEILKISGPERLYGVIIKFRQGVLSSSSSMNPMAMYPQYADPNSSSLQTRCNIMHQEERVLSPEELNLPPNASALVTSSFPTHSVPPTAVASSQASLALTPELIATLTSLLPFNNGSSGPTSDVVSGSESKVAYLNNENPAIDHNGQFLQHPGNQINSQFQYFPQAQVPCMTGYRPFNSYSQMHDQKINLPSQVAPGNTLQSRPMTMAREINQQYQQGGSNDDFMGQGIDHGRFFNPSIVQQTAYLAPLPNQIPGNDVFQPQPYMPLPPEQQQQQTASYRGVHEYTEDDAEKSERYKATLLLAANILSRTHQPPGNQPGQGAGSY